MDDSVPERISEAPAETDAAERRDARWWRVSRRAGRARRSRRKPPWWELPALVVLAILVAVGVKTFVVQPFYIPSGSMEHTLHGCPGCHGDRILVNKPIYDFRDPHAGDIVVFHAPPGWDDETASHLPSNPVLRAVRGLGQLIGFVPPDGEILVKRVIAVGGQTIKGSADGTVQISDTGPSGPFHTLNEPFVFTDPGMSQPAFGPITIPNGRLWVMGDHRTNSEDSRWHCTQNGSSDFGDAKLCGRYVQQATVPIGDVIGKAVVIAWPPSRWRTLGTPSTFTRMATAAGPALPSAISMVAVVPVYLTRRRKRQSPNDVEDEPERRGLR